MLMVAIDLALGSGRRPLPAHLGGVLHGTVEAALLVQAPQILPLLRPGGDQAPAAFAIQAPPCENPAEPGADETASPFPPVRLRFGVLLFGAAVTCWPELLPALAAQTVRRIQGREAAVLGASVVWPGAAPRPVWQDGQLLAYEPADPVALLAAMRQEAAASLSRPPARLHRLAMRSPLLLASRGAAREGLRRHGSLPWPSLGAVLDSIAQRLLSLEPDLAQALGLTPGWTSPAALRQVRPLTPADDPARQIEWTYRATSRHDAGSAPRNVVLPGILGTLLYPADGGPLESALLHWGQWMGVGQKTTLGCGQYVLSAL